MRQSSSPLSPSALVTLKAIIACVSMSSYAVSMNTTKQVGSALGLAALVVVAGNHPSTAEGFTSSYGRAFFAIALLLGIVAVLALSPSSVGGTTHEWILRKRSPLRGFEHHVRTNDVGLRPAIRR